MMQPAARPADQSQAGNWKSIASTGITQVVLGVLTIILGIVDLTVLQPPNRVPDFGSPIWYGFCVSMSDGIKLKGPSKKGLVHGTKLPFLQFY